jgi:hypothetical protein
MNDLDRPVIEGEINAMTDEEVTAALALSAEREDVEDPPITAPATGSKPVTVTDDNSSDEDNEEDDDPTNRYSMPLPPPRNPRLGLDIPVRPYVSQKDRSERYEADSRFSVPRDLREQTIESVRARRAPIPTIESQTKPPSKFKGEEMSFIKVNLLLHE